MRLMTLTTMIIDMLIIVVQTILTMQQKEAGLKVINTSPKHCAELWRDNNTLLL